MGIYTYVRASIVDRDVGIPSQQDILGYLMFNHKL